MKRFMAILLSGLLLTQSVPTVWAAPSGNTAANPCADWRDYAYYGKKACEAYARWGKHKQAAWDMYYNAAFETTTSPLWNQPASSLYVRYKQVAQDIHDLWNINPRYKDARAARFAGIILVTELIVTTAYIGGELIAPALEAGGYTMSAGVARMVPNTARAMRTAGKTARTLSMASVKKGVRSLITRMKGGKFWGDLGLTMGVMVADGMLTEGAFWVFEGLVADETAYLSSVKTDKLALKTRDLLREITNVPLTKQQQEELEKNKDDIYALKEELEQALKTALDKQGWQDDTEEGYLKHIEAVVTLHALQFIRAEMADLTDPLRYKVAANDFAQVFYSEDSSNSLALGANQRVLFRRHLLDVSAEKRRQDRLELSRSQGVVGSIKYVMKKMKEGR